jgi:hypothetical protein
MHPSEPNPLLERTWHHMMWRVSVEAEFEVLADLVIADIHRGMTDVASIRIPDEYTCRRDTIGAHS